MDKLHGAVWRRQCLLYSVQVQEFSLNDRFSHSALESVVPNGVRVLVEYDKVVP